MARRKSFLSRVWQALTGGDKPRDIIPEPKAAPPPPPRKPPKEPDFYSESDDDERLSVRLIRIFTANQTTGYRRRGINASRIRRNVNRMPNEIKDIARTASPDELLMYARYAEYTDDDGNNFFWYH